MTEPVPEPVAPSPRSPEADAATIFQLWLNHFHAGRHVATSPAMLSDTRTALDDVRRLLYTVEQPATDTERLIWLIENAATKENLVTLQEDIDAAIAAGTAADAQATTDATNRVVATINEKLGAIADLQAKFDADEAKIVALQAEIDAGTVTPATAQAVADAFASTKAGIDSIDAEPVVVTPTA